MALVDKPAIALELAQAALEQARGSVISRDYAASLLRALINIQVLTRVSQGVRFTHPGALAYLIAAESVRRVSASGRPNSLERLTAIAADTPSLSPQRGRADVERIVRTQKSEASRIVAGHLLNIRELCEIQTQQPSR
ncbi:MAG: hypothetical protein ACLQBY_01480 [Solirubrobacteraceae bacterium]